MFWRSPSSSCDHHDALGAGLAVIEYAPAGKSADEVRGLWQWVEAKLNAGVAADAPHVVSELASDIPPAVLLETPAEAVVAIS